MHTIFTKWPKVHPYIASDAQVQKFIQNGKPSIPSTLEPLTLPNNIINQICDIIHHIHQKHF